MKKSGNCIVIDDDLVSNMLCSHIIKSAEPCLKIQIFNLPQAGFEYVAKQFENYDTNTPTVLFLDIHMPEWTGWDFLDNFEKLDENIKKQFKIYVLSFSIHPDDIEFAKSNRNVVDYIVKPLNQKIVSEILSTTV